MIGYVSPTRQRTRILAPHLGAILAAWAIQDALRPHVLRGLGADALPADYNANVLAENAALEAYIPRVESAIRSRGYTPQIEYVAGGTSSGSSGSWARSDQYVIRIAEFPAWIGALVASWVTSYDPDERARYYIGEAQRWEGVSMYDNQYTSVSEPAIEVYTEPQRSTVTPARETPGSVLPSPVNELPSAFQVETPATQSTIAPVTTPTPRVMYYTEPYRPSLPTARRTSAPLVQEQIGAPDAGGQQVVDDGSADTSPVEVDAFDYQAWLEKAKEYWWLAAIVAGYFAFRGGRRR